MNEPQLEICSSSGTHQGQIARSPAVAEAIRITEMQIGRMGSYPTVQYLSKLREAFLCAHCWEAQLDRLAQQIPRYNRLSSYQLLTEAHSR